MHVKAKFSAALLCLLPALSAHAIDFPGRVNPWTVDVKSFYEGEKRTYVQSYTVVKPITANQALNSPMLWQYENDYCTKQGSWSIPESQRVCMAYNTMPTDVNWKMGLLINGDQTQQDIVYSILSLEKIPQSSRMNVQLYKDTTKGTYYAKLFVAGERVNAYNVYPQWARYGKPHGCGSSENVVSLGYKNCNGAYVAWQFFYRYSRASATYKVNYATVKKTGGKAQVEIPAPKIINATFNWPYSHGAAVIDAPRD